MIGRTFIILMLALISSDIWAVTKISTGSGDWTSGTTWSPSGVPGCGDSVIIQQNHVVSVTTNISYESCATELVLVLRGELSFTNGRKMKLPCNSRIYVFETGGITIQGGGSSNTLEICGTTFWESAMGPLLGPVCVPSTLPGCASVLPVELNSFEISNCSPGIACLDWETVSERNSAYFEIEFLDNMDWRKIAEVASRSKPQKPRAKISYHLQYVVEPGIHHFRLSQVDHDGSRKLLAVEALQAGGGPLVSVHPNPSTGKFTIYLPGGHAGTVIRVMNQQEASLYQHVVDTAEEMTFDVDLTRLSQGIYYLIIQQGNHRTSQKLVVL